MTKRTIRRAAGAAALLLALVLGAAAAEDTAEAQDTAQAEDTADAETADAGEPPPERAAEAGGDPGGFVPTEEISEDFAVSFPVDI